MLIVRLTLAQFRSNIAWPLQMQSLRAHRALVSLVRFNNNLPSSKQADTITHTGQKWDEKDWRLQRFDVSPKMVNPNIAAKLIAEKAPLDCGHERVVSCDGGHAGLGHPRVFINLDKPGNHACGYCGSRFFNSHVTKTEEEKQINHINC